MLVMEEEGMVKICTMVTVVDVVGMHRGGGCRQIKRVKKDKRI